MTKLMPSTIQYFSLITGLIFAILLSIMYLELNWLAIPAQVQRFGCIDGLRGYLALGVFYHHFFMWTSTFKYGKWIDPDVILFNNLGEATVACFFMITGALFYPKINKGFENTDWSRLYISRVFRILPLAWLAILAVFIVVFVKGWPSLDFSIPKMIKSIVLWFSFLLEPDIAGFHNSRRIIAGVTWSLKYEWIFYLSLPLMAILFTRFQKFVSNLTIILFLMVISLVMFSTFPKVAMKVATFIPLFLFGMLAAELSTMPRLVVVMRSVTASILGLIAVFFEIFRFSGSYGIVQYFLLSVFFIPVIAGNSYFGFLKHRASIALGEISYSIYLLHGLVLYFFMTSSFGIGVAAKGTLSLWLWSPILLVSVLLLSLLSYKFIEAPGIQLGKRLNSEKERRARLAEPALI